MYNPYPPPPHYEEPRPRSGFVRRVGGFLLLALIVGVGVFAFVATRRFSDETIALIAGLLLASIPLSFISLAVISIVLKANNRPRHEPPQQMMMPPMIIQMPQQPQAQGWHSGGGNGYDRDIPMLGGARSWDVIGGEDDNA